MALYHRLIIGSGGLWNICASFFVFRNNSNKTKENDENFNRSHDLMPKIALIRIFIAVLGLCYIMATLSNNYFYIYSTVLVGIISKIGFLFIYLLPIRFIPKQCHCQYSEFLFLSLQYPMGMLALVDFFWVVVFCLCLSTMI